MLKKTMFAAAISTAMCFSGAALAQDNHALDYVVGPQGQAAQGYYGGNGGATPWSTQEQVVPTLDYNYYYPAAAGYGTQARLYQSPRPVPLNVGYTYITYQPFAPHEYLWGHRAAYYSCYPGGVTVTRVKWGVGFHNHLIHALHPSH